MSSTKSLDVVLDELGSESLKERFARWRAKLAEPDNTGIEHRQVKDWAFGASIALSALGYDDLAATADEIWNPRRAK